MPAEKIQLPDGVPPLTTYYIYLTGGCNLACRHCWIAPTFQPNGGTGGHLDFELFKLAIEEGLPLGLNSIKLTGGEPLLHPDFVQMVDVLREKELGLTIETNGTLLTESLARYLKDKSTLGFISVSLDGASAETHDNFRGVKGSFEKACHGIRYLVEVGYRPQVIMSIHSGNVEEIEPLVRLAEPLGAGSVKLNLVQPSGRGELMTDRGQTLEIRQLIELGKWVEGDLQNGTAVSLHYSWPMAFYSLKRLLSFTGYSCNIFSILGILHTGHLAMCGIGTQIPELCYGLLYQDRIADLWASNSILIDLRNNLSSNFEGICKECILHSQCLGTCIAESYHLNRRLSAPFWFCQMANENDLFPASRDRSK
jgi:SynChlorMet cassette radical SAM/SPASM protein ScmF